MPRAGVKPTVGGRIACGDLRMSVQAGMSDGLWNWLTKQGWREIAFRPDRRRYRDIQHAFVTQLFDAHPDDWSRILKIAAEHASFRPHTLPGRRARLDVE